MDTMKAIKLTACIAWAGVAVASATPANALALAASFSGGGGGAYATCSGQSGAATYWCPNGYAGFMFNYYQVMKFVSIGCGSGACATQSVTAYVDSVYSTGRKITSVQGYCNAGTVYGLGPCAC